MLNNLSGVLRVDYGKSSVLLPGDIEGWAATSLLSHPGSSALNASLLLFPHHGGGWAHLTSSGATKTQYGQTIVSPVDFITAIAPTWTVLSVASDNGGNWPTYGHPGQDILNHLRQWHRNAGGGFVCTEVTPRCDGAICANAQAAPAAGHIAVPCGGSIHFDLSVDGSVVMHPAIHAEWQHVVDGLPHPQCRA